MQEIELTDKSLYNDFDNNALNIPQRSTEKSKYFVEFNRLLYSKRCIYFYIFLIISSVTIFFYSIFAYFMKLSELPIVICESLLIVVITFDMLIRIYVNGCKAYFKKILNYIDFSLILLNILTIILYMKFHNAAQEIEDISFALLIFIRNSSQLLRLYVLIKNQQAISKNVEEVINLNILFEEKRFEILSMKNKSSSHAISFVDEDFMHTGKISPINKKKHLKVSPNHAISSSHDDFGGIDNYNN